MAFLKKHGFLVVWAVGVLVCSLGKVPIWGIVLGSAAYGVLVLLLRFSRSLFWIGYFFQGVLNRPEVAFRLYAFAYRHGGRVGPPMIAYAMLLMQKTRYEEALALLEEVQNLPNLDPPTRKICRQNLAIACEKTGDVGGAIAVMEQMRQDYEYFRSDFYLTLAYFYIEAGEYDTAEQINGLARTEGEDCGAFYDNQALIAYKTGDLERAEALFRKALELDAAMISPRYYLGRIAEEKGDHDTAARYFLAVHNAGITGLNTVSREEAEEKYLQYFGAQAEQRK